MIFNKMIFLHYTEPDYLCFTSPNAFSVGMTDDGAGLESPSLEYSKDKATWVTFIAGTTTVYANANEKVYLRGNNEYINNSDEEFWAFVLDGTDTRASGNIMSLLDSTCMSTTISDYYCFAGLFTNNISLVAAPALPATTLADGCYQYMFDGCASLTTAPALPATTLAECCYQYMFHGCTSLITAPALPATTLEADCYNSMFDGCTSLTTAPALPATTLTNECYCGMFYECTSLTTVPALPATIVYADCYSYMFYNCSSLQIYSTQGEGHTHAWTIPTTGSDRSYNSQYYMFYGTIGNYSAASSVELGRTFYTQNEPV